MVQEYDDDTPLIEVGHESLPEYKKDQVPKFIIELEDFPIEIHDKYRKEEKDFIIKKEW